MKKLLLPLVFLLSALVGVADQAVCTMLDGATRDEASLGMTYVQGADGVLRITTNTVASLELFPATNATPKGTFLVFPGGGYRILSINYEGRLVARLLNEYGYDAAVLRYRINLGEKVTRPAALQDAQEALALVRQKGTSLKLSTRRVGVLGFSAGGHLAARLMHEPGAVPPPDIMALIYPAYLDQKGQLLDEVKPSATAPVFIVTTADDSVSATGTRLYAAAAGSLCDLHMPEAGRHGWGLKPERPQDVRDWPLWLSAFLDAHP
jgi:dienelactone hydrolase